MCTQVQLSANRVSINEMVVRGRDDAVTSAYEYWDITFSSVKVWRLNQASFNEKKANMYALEYFLLSILPVFLSSSFVLIIYKMLYYHE